MTYQTRPLILLALTIALFTISCKKECDKEEEKEPENMLIINFNEATISADLVDSAVVILTREGTTLPYFQRFDRQNGRLITSIETLRDGKWSAAMTIFGRSGTDNTGRMYEGLGTIFRSGGNASVYFQAPNGRIADSWRPRVVLADIPRSVTAIVALDNTDPFFQIIVKDGKWDTFKVERMASNRNGVGNELIASHIWNCNQGCYTQSLNIFNKTAFIPFTEVVAAKTWNNGEINILIKDTETTVVKELYYIYNK